MTETRKFWLESMLRICSPVLNALAEGKLRETMPLEGSRNVDDIRNTTYLEAFGRVLVGFAPWLAEKKKDAEEEKLRLHYAELTRTCIRNAVTPSSPDKMNFEIGYQPLVDAAFMAQGILRAFDELFVPLDADTKRNLADCMRATRTRKPYRSNWLLFGAMPEVLLRRMGEKDWDPMRVDYALYAHTKWYKGDGWYGDGEDFNLNYYNSFVIQPMLVDVITQVADYNTEWAEWKDEILSRASHYATHLEHFISPEGTYPLVGRSLTYRFGAFQTLSLMAYRHGLEDVVTSAGVRCALTKVIERTMSADSLFDSEGWLKIGVYGSQPAMGEKYISTGSLYLCSAVFIPLGLDSDDEFWSGPDEPWTSVKLWNGNNIGCEHAIH